MISVLLAWPEQGTRENLMEFLTENRGSSPRVFPWNRGSKMQRCGEVQIKTISLETPHNTLALEYTGP